MNTKIKELITRTQSAFIFGLAFWTLHLYFPPLFFSCGLVAVVATILIYEWPVIYGYRKPLLFFTPLYPILPFALLIFLNHVHHDLLFYLFALVFAFDTGSYLVGITCGKHKIVKAISPNKTWQGAIGGFFTTIIVLYLIQLFCTMPLSITTLISLAFIVSALAFAGDLFESFLKRTAGIKDTGSIIPGHGGLLDRFDSALFVVFFFYILRGQLATLLTCS